MNNAQKVQRPLLNFKASKDKAKDRRKSSSNDQNQEDIYRSDDAGDNKVISDHASDDDNDDMDDTLKLVDFDVHDEMKYKFLKFTDSYDAWMKRHKYEDQKLSDRHPFTVQQFSEEFSAILSVISLH